MRVYGSFYENYDGLDLERISLSPFERDCYYVNAEEDNDYETFINDLGDSSWKPYNVELIESYYYIPRFDEYVSEDELCDKYEEDEQYINAEKIIVYKEGEIVEEYFEHD